MATNRPTFTEELAAYNSHLDYCLRSRFGVTLKTFKSLKAATQLVGTAAGVYAMSLGADPLSTFALMALIITGPEGMEYLINQGTEGGT